MTYRVRFSARAERALSVQLPEKVASAALEFITGPLAENPHRVGKQLREPLYPQYSARRGEYRVVYAILEAEIVVHIVTVARRRDAYRG